MLSCIYCNPAFAAIMLYKSVCWKESVSLTLISYSTSLFFIFSCFYLSWDVSLDLAGSSESILYVLLLLLVHVALECDFVLLTSLSDERRTGELYSVTVLFLPWTSRQFIWDHSQDGGGRGFEFDTLGVIFQFALSDAAYGLRIGGRLVV